MSIEQISENRNLYESDCIFLNLQNEIRFSFWTGKFLTNFDSVTNIINTINIDKSSNEKYNSYLYEEKAILLKGSIYRFSKRFDAISYIKVPFPELIDEIILYVGYVPHQINSNHHIFRDEKITNVRITDNKKLDDRKPDNISSFYTSENEVIIPLEIIKHITNVIKFNYDPLIISSTKYNFYLCTKHRINLIKIPIRIGIFVFEDSFKKKHKQTIDTFNELLDIRIDNYFDNKNN